MNLLLTGADGFVGRHVQAKLRGRPLEGTDVAQGSFLDLRDAYAVDDAVGRALLGGSEQSSAGNTTDAVLHLAAQSHVAQSLADPDETWAVNFAGTYNLLSALGRAGFSGRMLYVSSGAVYGPVSLEHLPVGENHPLQPDTPYAASKAAAEALCHQWNSSGPFEVVIVRPFNHVGPGQAREFALSGFAAQLVEIGLGIREPMLRIGDLSVTRDFTDVRDVVDAYGLLLEHGQAGGVYNLCSGAERALSDILAEMIALAASEGLTGGHEVRCEIDPDRLRAIDQPRMWGNSDRMRQDTGWTPQHPWRETLLDILNEWKRNLS